MANYIIMTREMGEFQIRQRVSDGFFDATGLLNQWNELSKMQKQMIHFTENKATESFIEEIQKQENLHKRNSVLIQSRGKNGGTWMHPLLFVDFAMWLNPTFKYHVLKFVTDNLIQLRIQAKDGYNEFIEAIRTLPDRVSGETQGFGYASRALNYLVFNNHFDGIRNTATQKELDELAYFQRKYAELINQGVLVTFTGFLLAVKKEWNARWGFKNKTKQLLTCN